jgi:quercetin dioxygenase-like cupin family protein
VTTAAVQVTAARDLVPAAVPGHSFRIVADAAGTGGAYSLTEATSPPGAGVPPHVHDGSVECFFVLDGSYRLTVSGTTYDADPGGFVLVPRGAPHQFEVVGTADARAVVLFAPAGFETVFRRMPEIFGTQGEPGPLWEAVNAQFDTRLLDPELDSFAGPPAVTAMSSPSLLAGPAVTGTSLSLSLRSDAPGGSWAIDPGDAAAWIVEGCYRFDTPGGSFTLGEGEFISLDQTTPVRATALATGRALYLRT